MVDNWIETLLFYFQEYGGSRGENRYEIADTFIDEFSKVCLVINLNLMNEVD